MNYIGYINLQYHEQIIYSRMPQMCNNDIRWYMCPRTEEVQVHFIWEFSTMSQSRRKLWTGTLWMWSYVRNQFYINTSKNLMTFVSNESLFYDICYSSTDWLNCWQRGRMSQRQKSGTFSITHFGEVGITNNRVNILNLPDYEACKKGAAIIKNQLHTFHYMLSIGKYHSVKIEWFSNKFIGKNVAKTGK